MGKEAQPPMKDKPFEDSLIIRDVVSQAKDLESKSKADGVHSKVADPKKDPLIFFSPFLWLLTLLVIYFPLN